MPGLTPAVGAAIGTAWRAAVAWIVARFVASEHIDAWLRPTLSEPSVPPGEIVSTPDGPLRAAERSRGFVGFGGGGQHHRRARVSFRTGIPV